MEIIRAVDLFCGCGGMSLGFKNAGFQLLAAYDNWDAAINIYKSNFEHPIIKADLNEDQIIEDLHVLAPDIIIGGPPCQDFSIAGQRNMGERANLTIRYAHIIEQIKPEWFVMENVYNIERMPVLPKMIQIVKNAGYGLNIRVLDASRCGVPQKRNRFFMVGHLGDKDGFLDAIIERGLSDKQMTVYDYLGDSLDTEFYYMHPRSYNRRAVFSIYEPSSTIRGVNRPIPSNYQRHHADKAAITDGVRSLTTKERSYIQTFPVNFNFVGSKTEMEQAVGNAVPVKLAEYVAKCIIKYTEES